MQQSNDRPSGRRVQVAGAAGAMALGATALIWAGAAEGRSGDPRASKPPVTAKQARTRVYQPASGERAKNIILFIGDGMGVTHVDAARAR